MSKMSMITGLYAKRETNFSSKLRLFTSTRWTRISLFMMYRKILRTMLHQRKKLKTQSKKCHLKATETKQKTSTNHLTRLKIPLDQQLPPKILKIPKKLTMISPQLKVSHHTPKMETQMFH